MFKWWQCSKRLEAEAPPAKRQKHSEEEEEEEESSGGEEVPLSPLINEPEPEPEPEPESTSSDESVELLQCTETMAEVDVEIKRIREEAETTQMREYLAGAMMRVMNLPRESLFPVRYIRDASEILDKYRTNPLYGLNELKTLPYYNETINHTDFIALADHQKPLAATQILHLLIFWHVRFLDSTVKTEDYQRVRLICLLLDIFYSLKPECAHEPKDVLIHRITEFLLCPEAAELLGDVYEWVKGIVLPFVRGEDTNPELLDWAYLFDIPALCHKVLPPQVIMYWTMLPSSFLNPNLLNTLNRDAVRMVMVDYWRSSTISLDQRISYVLRAAEMCRENEWTDVFHLSALLSLHLSDINSIFTGQAQLEFFLRMMGKTVPSVQVCLATHQHLTWYLTWSAKMSLLLVSMNVAK